MFVSWPRISACVCSSILLWVALLGCGGNYQSRFATEHVQEGAALLAAAVSGSESEVQFFGENSAVNSVGTSPANFAATSEANVDGESTEALLTRAEARFRLALEFEPNMAEAHLNLGHVLELRGLTTEALASYRNALRIRADFAEAWSGVGVCLITLGDLENAESAFERALSYHPGLIAPRLNLSWLFLSLNRAQEARAHLLRLREMMPSLEVTALLAWAELYLGRPHAAEAALDCDPLAPESSDRQPGRGYFLARFVCALSHLQPAPSQADTELTTLLTRLPVGDAFFRGLVLRYSILTALRLDGLDHAAERLAQLERLQPDHMSTKLLGLFMQAALGHWDQAASLIEQLDAPTVAPLAPLLCCIRERSPVCVEQVFRN